MNYQQLRQKAKTGDVILHEGDSIGSRILRIGTASNYSHVALLYWKGNSLWLVDGKQNSLWIAEMKPGSGYTSFNAHC